MYGLCRRVLDAGVRELNKTGKTMPSRRSGRNTNGVLTRWNDVGQAGVARMARKGLTAKF